MAGVSETTGSASRDAAAALRGFLSGLGGLITFPVALVFALVGQFALGWFIMGTSPPPETGATAPGGATWAQGIVLVLQGAALAFAVSRGRLSAARLYLAIAALVWAIASLLLFYVALKCDLGGICL